MTHGRHRRGGHGLLSPRTCSWPQRTVRRDSAGPVIAVCTGDRCAALHRRTGHSVLDRLREATSATPGSVLVSCGCLGRCDLAALVLLGWTGSPPGVLLPLAGMDDPARVEALVRETVAQRRSFTGRTGSVTFRPPAVLEGCECILGRDRWTAERRLGAEGGRHGAGETRSVVDGPEGGSGGGGAGEGGPGTGVPGRVHPGGHCGPSGARG